MSIVETVLRQMSSVLKPQRTFLVILLTTLIYLPGKANFRNLSRYSHLHEKTYSRGFRRDFDFVKFNRLSLADIIANNSTWVVAIDCTFCPKSGEQTYGLDHFYNSQQGRAENGLELSTLALVDVDYNTAYPLSSRQTPPLDNPQETRVDDYLKHLQQDFSALPAGVRYVLADGYYSKIKFINGVCNLGLHLVSKLRHDANRRWLYHGPQKPRGRPKQYDGKVRFQLQEWDRFEKAGEVHETQVYTSVVNSTHFKRNVRIIYLMKPIGQKIKTALLYSTDIELPALEIYRLYKARFQIEFLFRDAKQFTGLLDCQARSPSALHFHFNASMTALNLLKLEDRQ
ncbi:transposase [Candidatus Contendibacter odensensis]|uniref:Transposase n=1 Tax=Candidatus Contendobacter odensis Run_B_J11 TaxID=1400861 RepID=A0A7U7GER1_9GAMM|nr:transposase [Candidatus Contendobacter odensis]CDH46828.1 transposase [Candidatus Contendobacter odensis Run_B_J11]